MPPPTICSPPRRSRKSCRFPRHRWDHPHRHAAAGTPSPEEPAIRLAAPSTTQTSTRFRPSSMSIRVNGAPCSSTGRPSARGLEVVVAFGNHLRGWASARGKMACRRVAEARKSRTAGGRLGFPGGLE